MSVQTVNLGSRSFHRGVIGDAWRRNPPLTLLIIGMLVMLAIALIGLVVDPRVITGAPAWMKTAKFAISITVYCATLFWLLGFVSGRPRLVPGISWAALLILGVEMALIVLQVLRGTTSHFNQATPFDATVFSIMGGLITMLWLLTLVVAVLLFRRRFAAPAIVWGVRLGLIAALLGMAVAFLMPRPTPAQEALIETTGTSPIVGAHAVGVEDGGPGLPVVGWSTTGGDLRVAHFVGLHGLQVIPFAGWLLASFAPAWLSARGRAQLAVIAGLAWIGLTLLLLWQALRAQPVIAPDAMTLLALDGIVLVSTVLSGIVVAWERRNRTTTS